MKSIPPFGINEHLIGPGGEEVTVLGFDEITDEEINSWFFSDQWFRQN